MENLGFKKEELESLIVSNGRYFAHLSVDEKKKETLIEHLLLTQEYFFKLIEVNKLEKTIWRLIKGITSDKNLQGIIAELFVKAIAAHDFGKVNPKFQKDKMKNTDVEDFKHNLSSTHSVIGAYLFVLYSEFIIKERISVNDESLIDYVILSLSYPILVHHLPYLNSISDVERYWENINSLKEFVHFFPQVFNDDSFVDEINEYIVEGWSQIICDGKNKVGDKFALFALVKLLYSLLTAADYYATTHFIEEWKRIYEDFGILDEHLKQKMLCNIKITRGYNKNIYELLEKEGTVYKNTYKTQDLPLTRSNRNLNILRQNLAFEVIDNLRKNFNNNLFYIEAPTGSGKTNLSMLALAELLKNDKNNEISKIFYVFPFTTLITQTFNSLKETFLLEQSEIVEIHSRAGFSSKNDDVYGRERENFIDYQFINYPVALISHVKFFDILKSNDKSANYLLHRLANSVVIIDELQAYSPKEWDKIVYFIYNYSKYFNIKFIIMSATLPKIDGLLTTVVKNYEFKNVNFIKLVKDKGKYFTNPNFKDRVEFDFRLLDIGWNKESREEYFCNLWNRIERESEKYAKENTGRVRTIVEFIFNKTVTEFVSFIESRNDNFFDEIFILSGTILEPRRREVIAKLKNRRYQNKKILLITTQVVEAGVDIDMDIGFKDVSIIDSEEQLAGRINRNVKKKGCKLFLFDLDDESVIYRNDDRYKILRKESMTKYLKVLESKNFDLLYNEVIRQRNKYNEAYGGYINIREYLKHVENLRFGNVSSEFRLIENRNCVSVFVPIEIPVKTLEQESYNFTTEELKFLNRNGIYQDVDEKVDGEKIWKLYCDIIKGNNNISFERKKVELVIMQGLLSKFSFSVYTRGTNFEVVSTWGAMEKKYGFYKINNVTEIYDYCIGIKRKLLNETIFL